MNLVGPELLTFGTSRLGFDRVKSGPPLDSYAITIEATGYAGVNPPAPHDVPQRVWLGLRGD